MVVSNARNYFLFIAMIILSGASFAQQLPSNAKGEMNVVEVTILRDGQVIGTPKLIMQVGSSAVLTVAKADGYSIKGSLGRDNRMDNGRSLGIELFIADNGRWKLLGKPTISVQLNGAGRLSYPDAQGRNLEINVAVTDKFSGDISMQSWGQNKCSARKIADWSNMMKGPVKVDFTDKPGGCCKSGNLTCCSDGPVCCGSGDGQSCCT